MVRPHMNRLALPEVRPVQPAPARYPLKPVSPRSLRRRRPKVFFASVSVVFLLLVIVAQILLSITLQSGAYEIAGLQQDVKDLGRAEQSASQDINRLASPQNVARSAESVGMVSNSTPAYLRLSDATTSGWVSQATGGSTLYPRGDMVPNVQLTEVFAQREAAAKNAQIAREAKARAQISGGTAATGNAGAPIPESNPPQVASTMGMPAPTTH